MPDRSAQLNDRFVAGAKKFSRAAGALVTLVGALVLTGWLFDIHGLKSVYADITMKANAALSLLLAGASLWALNVGGERTFARRAGQACAAAVALVGALTLSEHLFGWNLGIDQLLFTEPAGAPATTSPGRMGPPASVCFALSGGALLLHARRSIPLAQLLAAVVCVVSLLPVLGYAYRAEALYGVARYTGIALHTAVSLFVLGLGLLTTCADEGVTSVVCSNRAGGLMARRLLPAAIVVPFLIGWLRLLAQRAGYYDLGFGIALFVLSIIIFALLVWRSAARLNDIEGRRMAAEAATREKEEGLLRQAALIGVVV